MASYSIQTSNISQTTPVLARGRILIVAEQAVYFRIGSENPQADKHCAFISAGGTREISLPTSCLKLAVLAVNTPGNVTVVEINGTKASCSV